MAGFGPELLVALRAMKQKSRGLSWRLMWYAGRRFAASALVCLLTFSAMFLIAIVLDDLQHFMQHDAGGLDFLAYLLLFVPQYLVHALPMSLVVGALFAVGSLSRTSELVAMWAAGVSIRQLILPIFGIALCFAMVQFALVCQAPHWRGQAVSLRESLGDPLDVRNQEQERSYLAYHDRVERRSWLFHQFEPVGTCHFVTVTQYRGDGTISWELRAPRGEFSEGTWWFEEAQVSHYDDEGFQLKGEPVILDGRQQQAELVDDPRSFTMMVGLRVIEDVPLGRLYEVLYKSERPLAEMTRATLETQFFAYVLAPLSCIIAVLIGVPMGISHGRNRTIRNFLLGLALMISYHLCVEVFLVLGRLMLAPPVVVATVPPVLYMAGGAVGLYRKR